MRVVVLLADSAQTDRQTGKVHALGLGWTSVVVPTTVPIAVIALLMFDTQEEARGSHAVTLTLLDENGKPVPVTLDGDTLVIRSEVLVEDSRTLPEHGPVTSSFVVGLGPGIPLEPGHVYRWQAAVDGTEDPLWSASFYGRENDGSQQIDVLREP